jgi:predicted AlkP superfamily phosphohydrolase/phosphomutase
MANSQGKRVGIYNLPLTYPPQPLEGWMVSGMMTPGFGEKQRGISHPAELESKILEWAPDYVVDVSANWETDWRDATLCDRVVDSLEQRYKVLSGLLETDPVDVVFSVLEAPDRMQHVYYRYMDPNEAMYDSPEGRALRPAIEKCFAYMDRIVGLLEDYAGPDGGVIVCSDHGFTAWEVSVHTNALLAEWGYLKLKPVAKAMQTKAARSQGQDLRRCRLEQDESVCVADPATRRVHQRRGAREVRDRPPVRTGSDQGRSSGTLRGPQGAGWASGDRSSVALRAGVRR